METGELRYYHSSQNNSRFFDVPHLIRTEEDLERFLDELQGQDILEFIRQQRPDTKWVVHLLTNVTFYVNKLFDHLIGARLRKLRKNGALDSQPQVIKFLPMVGGSLRVLRLLRPLKVTGRHDKAEILLKVALITKNQNKKNHLIRTI
jgi:hypothetical protein